MRSSTVCEDQDVFAERSAFRPWGAGTGAFEFGHRSGWGGEGVLRGLRPVEAVRIIVFLAHGKVELIFGSCKSLRGEQ